MSPENSDPLEEQFSLLLAACDDALAAGHPAHSAYDTEAPDELRGRLEREVAWCRMVRRLLLVEGGSTGPPLSITPAGPGAPAAPMPTRLGRFRIRQELGRGGFGVVLLAYDPKLGREVALKVPRPEALTNPELRARFQQEARATAGLDHPNLVPVYEAGDEDGVCWIASAYCPGITLSAWLKGRSEPVPFALAARLVATLAEAVEHAHRRGILHRDLKPANVMLSPRVGPARQAGPTEMDFVPRLMDFGLAKVMEGQEDALTQEHHTHSGAILGTPAYMAPEQAESKGRTTGPAIDVYSLGAILYEVLTGQPPFRGDTPLETLWMLRTQDPLSPQRLRPKLPRDLETICLKCLHKEPRKRYASAQALADDLCRFLAGEPIRARPVSRWERGLKWARRRPAAAALVAVSATAIVVVVLLASVYTAQLREQRNLAESRRQDAERSAEEARDQRGRALAHLRSARDAVDRMLTRVGQESLAPAPYTIKVREKLLQDAVQLYEELARQEDSDPEIRFEVGLARRRLGKIQQAQQAEQNFRKAVEVFEQLTAEDPDKPAYWQELAASCNNLGIALQTKEPAEAERLLRRALDLQDQLAAAHPETRAYRLDASVTRGDLAALMFVAKRPEEALRLSAEAIDGLEKLLSAEPASAENRHRLGVALNSHGAYLGRLVRLREAEPFFRRAVEVFEPLAEGPAALPERRSLFSVSCANLGLLLRNTGRPAEGEPFLRRAVAVKRKLTSDYPEVASYHTALGWALGKLAGLVRDRGELPGAVALWEEAIAEQRLALKSNPGDAEQRQQLGESCCALADTCLLQGRYQGVEDRVADLSSLLAGRGQGEYYAARFLSRCIPLVENDKQLSPAGRTERQNRYATRAGELLRKAHQMGLANLASIDQDEAFAPLRSRPDFPSLLSELGQKP
jgi:eukaryotic-like serine/threonine-protein kinase